MQDRTSGISDAPDETIACLYDAAARLASEPASSLEGVCAKAQVLHRVAEVDPSDVVQCLLHSVCEDLQRLIYGETNG